MCMCSSSAAVQCLKGRSNSRWLSRKILGKKILSLLSCYWSGYVYTRGTELASSYGRHLCVGKHNLSTPEFYVVMRRHLFIFLLLLHLHLLLLIVRIMCCWCFCCSAAAFAPAAAAAATSI